MAPLGIPEDVRLRNKLLIGQLSAIKDQEHLELELSALWSQVAWHPDSVSDQYRSDLGEITAAFKKTQVMLQAEGLA